MQALESRLEELKVRERALESKESEWKAACEEARTREEAATQLEKDMQARASAAKEQQQELERRRQQLEAKSDELSQKEVRLARLEGSLEAKAESVAKAEQASLDIKSQHSRGSQSMGPQVGLGLEANASAKSNAKLNAGEQSLASELPKRKRQSRVPRPAKPSATKGANSKAKPSIPSSGDTATRIRRPHSQSMDDAAKPPHSSSARGHKSVNPRGGDAASSAVRSSHASLPARVPQAPGHSQKRLALR